jgi:hypothetical protein
MAKAPIFILGMQRSGTTLLVSMLDKHPMVNMLPSETHLYVLFYKLFSYKNIKGKVFKSYCDEVLPKINKGWTLPENQEALKQILSHIENEEHISLEPNLLMENFIKFWTNDENVISGEKTPAHIFYVEKILKQFPDARIIILLRDPRAVMLSDIVKLQNNKDILVQFNLFNFIFRIQCVFDLAKKWQKKFPNNVQIYQFEDIISSPEIVLQSISKFINIEYFNDMLNVGVVNSSFGDENQKDKNFNEENKDRWKSQLTAKQINWCEYFLQKTLHEYGYKLTTNIEDKPPLKKRIVFFIARKINYLIPSIFHHLNRQKKYRVNTIQ